MELETTRTCKFTITAHPDVEKTLAEDETVRNSLLDAMISSMYAGDFGGNMYHYSDEAEAWWGDVNGGDKADMVVGWECSQ